MSPMFPKKCFSKPKTKHNAKIVPPFSIISRGYLGYIARKDAVYHQLNVIEKLKETDSVIYYDQYTELRACMARLKDRYFDTDPLERYCSQSPWAIECKLFD